MASRAFWKGYLKLSLVTCPVAMMPATTATGKVSFHTLNRATGHRVESRYIDAESGRPVEEDDEVRGYQKGPHDYVTIEDEELEAVELESVRTIDIDVFAPKESIGWIWYDQPHYLMPDDPVGEEAFSVIRDAMEASGVVGISRLVLYRRERAVMLEPRERGIVLWTLRYGQEVRDPKPYFGGLKEKTVEPRLMSLITALIDERRRNWGPELVQDPVQDRLKEIIAARNKGRRPHKPRQAKEEKHPDNVISIMDALRKSLAASGKQPRKLRPD